MCAARQRSSAVFGNDKVMEVVLALHRWPGPAVTAQELARATNINHDLVKRVLTRLELVSVVKPLDRIGGTRGPLPYEVLPGATWSALVELSVVLEQPETRHSTDALG